MSAKRKLKSTSVQSDQSLFPHEETLHPWLSEMRLVKFLIILRKLAGWSESSLGAHIRRYDFWRCGSLEYHLFFCFVLKHISCVCKVVCFSYSDKYCNVCLGRDIRKKCQYSRTFPADTTSQQCRYNVAATFLWRYVFAGLMTRTPLGP